MARSGRGFPFKALTQRAVAPPSPQTVTGSLIGSTATVIAPDQITQQTNATLLGQAMAITSPSVGVFVNATLLGQAAATVSPVVLVPQSLTATLLGQSAAVVAPTIGQSVVASLLGQSAAAVAPSVQHQVTPVLLGQPAVALAPFVQHQVVTDLLGQPATATEPIAITLQVVGTLLGQAATATAPLVLRAQFVTVTLLGQAAATVAPQINQQVRADLLGQAATVITLSVEHQTYSDSIEAWVTTLSGTYVGHLENSAASPFRNRMFSIERNRPGVASFEYHRDNAAVKANPALVALDNLLWLKYRGVTRVYVMEQRAKQLDEQEHATGWFKVAGPGVLALLSDRLVWPDGFTGAQQPSAWTSQWRTIAGQAAGQMLWTLISETNSRFPTQIVQGTIQTTAGDAWTQQFRFDSLKDVMESVTAALGDVDMNGLTFNYYNSQGTDRSTSIIFEEGADIRRVSREESKRDTLSWIIAEGVGEGVFAKIATATDAGAARRREGYLDAKDAGSLSLLQLSADAALTERGPTKDGIALDVTEDRYTALINYGMGDTVRVIAPSADVDQTARIVALYVAETDDEQVRVSIDVNSQRTEYLLSLAEGNESNARSIGIQNRLPQGQLVPFNFSGSSIFDTDVPMEVFFRLPTRVFLVIEVLVNLALRQFWAPSRAAIGTTTASGGSQGPTTSSGGSQAPTTSSDGYQAPSTSTDGYQVPTTAADGGQAPTSAAGGAGASTKNTADADGGQTSSSNAAASSDTTSGSSNVLYDGNTGVNTTAAGSNHNHYNDHGHAHTHGMGHNHSHSHSVTDHGHGMAHNHGTHTHSVTIAAHTHTVTVAAHAHSVTVSAHAHSVYIAAHDHTVTVAAHTHTVPQLDLVYGMFRETMPASWSVVAKVYELVGSTWTLRYTSSAITGAASEINLTSIVTTAGSWKITLQSNAAQPNGGRLAGDVWGAILGAIQSV